MTNLFSNLFGAPGADATKLPLSGGTLTGLLTASATHGIAFAGSTSGAATVKAPAVAGTPTITLPAVTSTLATLGANTYSGAQSLGGNFLYLNNGDGPRLKNGMHGGATAVFYNSYDTACGGWANQHQACMMAKSLHLGDGPNWGPVILGANSTDEVMVMGVSGATTTPQKFKAANGVGTNIAGGKMSIAPGQSTGSATPAILALQGTSAGSSGTTSQTLVDVLSIIRAGVVRITGIPTSSAGLSSGDIYSNAGVLTIVP